MGSFRFVSCQGIRKGRARQGGAGRRGVKRRDFASAWYKYSTVQYSTVQYSSRIGERRGGQCGQFPNTPKRKIQQPRQHKKQQQETALCRNYHTLAVVFDGEASTKRQKCETAKRRQFGRKRRGQNGDSGYDLHPYKIPNMSLSCPDVLKSFAADRRTSLVADSKTASLSSMLKFPFPPWRLAYLSWLLGVPLRHNIHRTQRGTSGSDRGDRPVEGGRFAYRTQQATGVLVSAQWCWSSELPL